MIVYDQDDLTFWYPSLGRELHVLYRYKSLNQTLVNPSNVQRMTGFKLNWFVQNIDGETTHNPENRSMKFHNSELVSMIELAQSFRLKGLSREEIRDEAYKLKIKQFSGLCFNGQLESEERSNIFDELLSLAEGEEEYNLIDQDFKTGFSIFTTARLCDRIKMKLNKFLLSLFSIESPRTILKTMVSLFESVDIKDKSILRDLFLALDSVFHMQYGKVLLALASLEDLGRMVDAGWPYFTPYIEDLQMCLNQTSCTGLQQVIQSIGKALNISTHLWFYQTLE